MLEMRQIRHLIFCRSVASHFIVERGKRDSLEFFGVSDSLNNVRDESLLLY